MKLVSVVSILILQILICLEFSFGQNGGRKFVLSNNEIVGTAYEVNFFFTDNSSNEQRGKYNQENVSNSIQQLVLGVDKFSNFNGSDSEVKIIESILQTSYFVTITPGDDPIHGTHYFTAEIDVYLSRKISGVNRKSEQKIYAKSTGNNPIGMSYLHYKSEDALGACYSVIQQQLPQAVSHLFPMYVVAKSIDEKDKKGNPKRVTLTIENSNEIKRGTNLAILDSAFQVNKSSKDKIFDLSVTESTDNTVTCQVVNFSLILTTFFENSARFPVQIVDLKK